MSDKPILFNDNQNENKPTPPIKRVPLFSEKELPKLIEAFTELPLKVIKGLDLLEKDSWLTGIPFGKLFSTLFRKIVQIQDTDKALRLAVARSYFFTFLEGLEQFQLTPELSVKALKNTLGVLESFAKEHPVQIDTFDVKAYLENPPMEAHRNSLSILMKDSNLTQGQQIALEKYIADWAEINFWRVVEESEVVYEKLNKKLGSRSYEKLLLLQKKKRYEAALKNLYREPVWGDTQGMTLEAIYVEPHFQVHSYCFKDGSYRSDNFQDVNYPPKSIHYFVDDWLHGKKVLNAEAEKSNILFLFGYPGQGKTSFCKRLLFDTYSGDSPLTKPLHFIKLRDIEAVEDLMKNPLAELKAFVKESRESKEEISRKQFTNAVWLLDGLDELHQQNNMPKTSIEGFCMDLIELSEKYKELKIIVTSRFGYLDLKNLKSETALLLQLKTFNLAQQKEWLDRYLHHHPECKLDFEKLQSIHDGEGDKYERLQELTNQPILLQMIAQSDYLIDEDAFITNIYSQLFSKVIKRGWSADGKLRKIKGLKPEFLREFLRNIAFAIFQSPHEYLHKSQLEEVERAEEFKMELQKGNLSSALKGLMLAFYMKEVPKQSSEEGGKAERGYDFAIEFLHKSLQEFLTAEKIWEDLKEKLLENSKPYTNKFVNSLKLAVYF